MAQPQPIISTNYPFLPIRFTIRGSQYEALALLDTGFAGALAVPYRLARRLGNPDTSTNWLLADGSSVEAPAYLGDVEVVGLPPVLDVTITVLGDEYILGTRIIDRFEVTFDHGTRVIVRP